MWMVIWIEWRDTEGGTEGEGKGGRELMIASCKERGQWCPGIRCSIRTAAKVFNEANGLLFSFIQIVLHLLQVDRGAC